MKLHQNTRGGSPGDRHDREKPREFLGKPVTSRGNPTRDPRTKNNGSIFGQYGKLGSRVTIRAPIIMPSASYQSPSPLRTKIYKYTVCDQEATSIELLGGQWRADVHRHQFAWEWAAFQRQPSRVKIVSCNKLLCNLST